MSKQLTLSATFAVMSMALFAIVSSVTFVGEAGTVQQKAGAPLLGIEAQR